MAGAPQQQQPRIVLPGYEYIVTAGTRDVALDRRLSVGQSSAITSVGAGLTVSLDVEVNLVVDFTPRDGFYCTRAECRIVPQDTAGELQILASRLFFLNGAGGEYEIGIPLNTQLTPATSLVLLNDRDIPLLMQDLLAPNGAGTQQIAGPWATVQPFNIHAQATIKNLDSTNAHSSRLTVHCIGSVLRGFQT